MVIKKKVLDNKFLSNRRFYSVEMLRLYLAFLENVQTNLQKVYVPFSTYYNSAIETSQNSSLETRKISSTDLNRDFESKDRYVLNI